MFDCIIPIGESCNITFLLQNSKLKKQTSLFEWFISPNLNDITNILIKIGNNTDIDIIKMIDRHVFIGDRLFSAHYTYENFVPIYQRRRDRLITTIKSSKNILFTRFESANNVYNKNDIDNFINSIILINPNIENIKLFLISPNEDELNHPSISKIFYNNHHNDCYCQSFEINNLFITELEKIGYNIKDTTEIYFTDTSEF